MKSNTNESESHIEACQSTGTSPTRSQLVQNARLSLSAQFPDDPAGVVGHLASRYGIDRDEAADIVAEATRSPLEEVTHNTDAGNAARLARWHGDRVRYVYEERRWLAWNGRAWAPDATGAVERYAKDTVRRLYVEGSKIADTAERERAIKWALASEAAARLDAMMRLARSDTRIVVRGEDLDADPWALNVANGIIDLRTGGLRPHNPDEMHSKMAAAALPEEPAPATRWDAFLAEVLPDPEVRRFVQKLAGYSLAGEVGENVLPFPYGSGANGKSVFLGVLREVLGDYATEAAPDLLVARRERGIPVDIADLRGFRFVTTTEVEGGRRMATDVMKRITGESRLKARLMRQNYEDFRNVTKLWMAANDRPQVDGLDEAVWRRLRLIPFTVTIPPERRDPFLIAKLLEERDGILAWAVEGCLAWQRDGLGSPAAVLAATEEYREDSNPLRDWIDSDADLAPGEFTPSRDLRDAYERHCRLVRARPIPKGKRWADGLNRLDCVEGRRKIDGASVRGWVGVRLIRSAGGGLQL